MSLKVKSQEISAKVLMSQRWDEGLSDVRYPVVNESLIPMFERMVDRAFSGTPRESERTTPEEKHVVHKISIPAKPSTKLPSPSRPKDLVR